MSEEPDFGGRGPLSLDFPGLLVRELRTNGWCLDCFGGPVRAEGAHWVGSDGGADRAHEAGCADHPRTPRFRSRRRPAGRVGRDRAGADRGDERAGAARSRCARTGVAAAVFGADRDRVEVQVVVGCPRGRLRGSGVRRGRQRHIQEAGPGPRRRADQQGGHAAGVGRARRSGGAVAVDGMADPRPQCRAGLAVEDRRRSLRACDPIWPAHRRALRRHHPLLRGGA